MATGDSIQARAEFGRAIELEPKQPMFYSAEGLASVVEALGRPPLSSLWHNLSAPSKEEDQNLSAAEQDFKKSIRLSGNDSAFWTTLGWVQAYRGEENEAAGSFERAIQIDPHDAVTRISTGLLYERVGLKAKASEQYASALATRPGILDSGFYKDLRLRDSDFAKAVVERAVVLLKGSPNSPSGLACLAKLQTFLGEESLAHVEYVSALDTLPNLSYTWANLGMLDLNHGNRTLARLEFERALFLDEMNRLALNMLALMDFEDGNTDRAKYLYGGALLSPQISEHSERDWRVYYLTPPVLDDVVPSGLLPYISPDIHPLEICDQNWLSMLYRSGGNAPDVNNRIFAQEDFCNKQ